MRRQIDKQTEQSQFLNPFLIQFSITKVSFFVPVQNHVFLLFNLEVVIAMNTVVNTYHYTN